VLWIVRWENKRRLGVVELPRDGGHLLGAEAAGIGEDGELVTAKLRVRKHVGGVELVWHVRLRRESGIGNRESLTKLV